MSKCWAEQGKIWSRLLVTIKASHQILLTSTTSIRDHPGLNKAHFICSFVATWSPELFCFWTKPSTDTTWIFYQWINFNLHKKRKKINFCLQQAWTEMKQHKYILKQQNRAYFKLFLLIPPKILNRIPQTSLSQTLIWFKCCSPKHIKNLSNL